MALCHRNEFSEIMQRKGFVEDVERADVLLGHTQMIAISAHQDNQEIGSKRLECAGSSNAVGTVESQINQRQGQH
jgi:hypothetical protein